MTQRTTIVVTFLLWALRGQEIFAYDTVQWTKITPSGTIPKARQQVAGVRAQQGSTDCMFIFGGLNNWEQPDGLLNDLWCYNIAKNMWTELKGSGTPPSARRRHSVVAGGGFLVVFGGIDGNYQPVNSLGKYDIANNKWISVNPSGAPAARSGHTAVAMGSKMIVFGGQGASSFFNDIYQYDIQLNTWSVVKASGYNPVARALMSAITIGTDMYVFGGLKGFGGYKFYLDELLKLDTLTNQWSLIVAAGAPEPRAHHGGVVVHGKKMAILCGYSTVMLSDAFIYDPNSPRWSFAEPVGDTPIGREALVAISLTDDKVMLFGGYNGYWDGVLDEIYVLEFGTATNASSVASAIVH